MPLEGEGAPETRRPVRFVLATIASTIGAIVLYLAANLSMLLSKSDWSWKSFRSFGSGDQLSYLAYVSNVSKGVIGQVEPFNETGTSSYPRAYYVALGHIAGLFNISPGLAWSVCGVLVQVVLVIVLALVCVRISGHSWTALLAAVPFVVGVMSKATGHGYFRQMDSHAVLWGPFAVLFPLNGEAFGLSVAAACFLLLSLVVLRTSTHRRRVVSAIIAAVLIGALANVQTYSFLSAVYLAVYVLAAYSLITYRRRWPIVVSLVLVPVLFVLGPVFPFRGSQLVTLGLGLLPALPGILLLIRRTRGFIVLLFAAAGIAASPSVIGVLLGLYRHDPFLVYRVASSKNLGVFWGDGLLGSTVVAIPLILLFIAGIQRRRPVWMAYAVGVTAAWALLSSNDLWGANQEPYRLWIDCFMLIAFSVVPFLLDLAKEYLGRGEEHAPVREPLGVEFGGSQHSAPVSRTARIIAGSSIVLIAASVGISAFDWAAFYKSMNDAPLIPLQGDRQSSLVSATRAAGSGLIVPDTCIDPLTLKTITAKRIAFMNVGMAWPADYEGVINVNVSRAAGKLDLPWAAEAKVKWVLTDSSCVNDWAKTYADNLTLKSRSDYRDGTISLWLFTP